MIRQKYPGAARVKHAGMMNKSSSTPFAPQINSLKFICDCCEDAPSFHNVIIINTEKE